MSLTRHTYILITAFQKEKKKQLYSIILNMQISKKFKYKKVFLRIGKIQ